MIVDNGKYYLYRHIRLDKNEPFYIGVGTKKNNKKWEDNKIYLRSNVSIGRNITWNRIVAKTEYAVDILLESDDRHFVLKKEIEFIKLYGRIDLCTGTLCNFTDGGEGALNISKDSIIKRIETKKKTGSFYRNKEHLKKYRLPKGAKSDWTAKKCYLYSSINGNFISDYRSATDCSIYVNMSDATVNKMCRNNNRYKQFIFSYNDLGEKINPNDFKERKHLSNKVIQYNKDTGDIIKIWETGADAARHFGLHIGAVTHAIRSGNLSSGYKWGIFDTIKSEKIPVPIHIWKSCKKINKIDKITGIIIKEYNSGADAAKELKVSNAAICQALKNGSLCCGYKWDYCQK